MVIRSEFAAVFFALAALLVGGCSKHAARVAAPTVDAAAAGQAAMEQYDTNHDGAIAGKELDACPAIKSGLADLDNHGDGRVTAATIAARIRQWRARAGAMSVDVIVQLDGRPLDKATVVFDPEKFLGPNFSPAEGISTASGFTAIRRKLGLGVPLGLYNIRITKLVDGKESIPARYNTHTTLGIEVAPSTPPKGITILKLTSQ